MRISKGGLELIKSFEGFRSKAYQDSVGVWTIGYGHTRGVKPGMVVTREQAEMSLRFDVSHVEEYLNKHELSLKQNQFDALVSLFYNIGNGYLKNFLPDLKDNPDSDRIPNRILKYVYAGGKILHGLVKRRQLEANLYKK